MEARRVRGRIVNITRTDQQYTSADVIKVERGRSIFIFCVFLAVYKIKNTQKSTLSEWREESEKEGDVRDVSGKVKNFLEKFRQNVETKKLCLAKIIKKIKV